MHECNTNEECHPHEECHHGHDKGKMHMHIVHEAKMELIKDRVKKKLEVAMGKKLDEMAELIVQAKMSMMKSKMQMMKEKEYMMANMEAIWKSG